MSGDDPQDDLPAEADALFEHAPEDFVGARNDLVKQLRTQGRKDDAAAVRALRRPSVGAWVLNRLARDESDAVDALLDAGRSLRAAHQHATTKGDAGNLRTATERRRVAIDALLHRAERLLESSGRARTHISAIEAGLLAVTLDEGAAEAFRSGRLVSEPEPRAFPIVDAFRVMPGGKGDAAEDAPAADVAMERRIEELRAEVERLDREARKAIRAAEQEEAKAARAREEVERQRAIVDEASARAEEERDRASEATQRAERLRVDLSALEAEK